MKFKFTVTGLDCPNCAAKLADIISKKDGVESAKINFLTEKITVEATLDEKQLLDLLNDTSKKFDKAVKIEK